MGLTLIQNQPIVFNRTDAVCGCPDNNFRQYVDQTEDITNFQFILDPCPDAPQLIDNSEFETTDDWRTSGWTINAAQGLAIKPDGVAGTLRLLGITGVGSLYQLTVKVKKLTGTLEFNSGSTVVKTITSPGLFVFNFEAVGNQIMFEISDTDSYCEIDYVTLIQINPNLAWGIINENGETVHVQAYQDDSSSFCLYNRFVTVKVEWSELDLDNGCYTIGISDPCENECGQNGIPNGDFGSGDDDWSANISAGTPTSTFTAGLYELTGTTADRVKLTHLAVTLCSGVEYNYTIVVTKASNASARVQFGTNQSSLISTVGTHTGTVTANGATFLIDITCSGVSAQFTIESIEISLVSDTDYTFTYTSVPIRLGDYTAQCNVNKIVICNNDDAWGFGFEGGCFSPVVRLESAFGLASYPTERELNEFNNGNREVQFSERRKVRPFGVKLVPEYILDFLSLIPSADHVYIGETEYASDDDEIAVSAAPDTHLLGNMTVNLSEKKSLINVNIGNQSSGCEPGYTFLTDPTNNEIIITEPADQDQVVSPKK